MKTLTAGPWVGEFGWELFCWQASLRAIAKDYDNVIVCARPGHEALYSDFCTEYIPFSADVNLCSGRRNFLRSKKDPFACIKSTAHISCKKLGEPREFIKFGHANPELKFDIVMHARRIQSPKSVRHAEKKMASKLSRNWDLDKWNDLAARLLNEGLRVCSVGAETAAYHVQGSEKFLGVPLSKLVDLFASSKLAIGPSSGPMHLASLCGCPHFVWTAKCNIKRYNHLWNPLNTPVQLLVDETWNPSVNDVFKGVMKVYNER